MRRVCREYLYNRTPGLLPPTPGKVLDHGVTEGAKNTVTTGLSAHTKEKYFNLCAGFSEMEQIHTF